MLTALHEGLGGRIAEAGRRNALTMTIAFAAIGGMFATPCATAGPDHPADAEDQIVLQADMDRMRVLWERFQAAHDGTWRATWDETTNLPRIIVGGRTAPQAGEPAEVARAIVVEHEELFGLKGRPYALPTLDVKETKNARRVSLRQTYEGLDVFDARLVIAMDDENRVLRVASSIWPVGEIDLVAELTLDGARRALLSAAAPDAVITEGPKLIVYAQGRGVLAYMATVNIGEPAKPWRYIINADTGEVLERAALFAEHGGDEEQNDSASRLKVFNADRSQGAPGRPSNPAPASRASPEGAVPDLYTWTIIDPDVVITELGPPETPFDISADVAASSFGVAEDGFQLESIYAAGMQLLPGVEYTVNVSWDAHTWDSYNNFAPGSNGFWDVFFMNVNSTDFYWNLIPAFANIANVACEDAVEVDVFFPGITWAFGGDIWGDGVLCSGGGDFVIDIFEPHTNLDVFLTFGLDTLITGDVDGLYPSWGTFEVHIAAPTYVFNPNPVTALNDATLTDQSDANGAVPANAYVEVTLDNLDAPGADGLHHLTGDFVKVQDIEAPAIAPPTSPDGEFPYIRKPDAFEAVMVYFHIDASQQYIQSLGFMNVNNRQILVDHHGLNGADNSYYTTAAPGAAGMGYLAFGDGGVDDAEDADVIVHEYGHAIHDNQSPGTYFGAGNPGFGDETGAMGEGFGDYWACSAFNAANVASGFNPAIFAEWDAQSAMGLRRLDNTKVYPNNMVNQIHDDGEMWSGALWNLFGTLGKATTDTLVLESHFWVPANPTFADGAEAILFADLLENFAANEQTIADTFVARGIFRRIMVTSVPAGADIEVDTMDVLSADDGAAPFQRDYRYNQMVELTAPAMHNGDPFSHWVVKGVAQPMGQQAVTVTLDNSTGLNAGVPVNHTAEAVFGAANPADFNGDGQVNGADLAVLLANWGGADPDADLNDDGVVNGADLAVLLANWG